MFVQRRVVLSAEQGGAQRDAPVRLRVGLLRAAPAQPQRHRVPEILLRRFCAKLSQDHSAVSRLQDRHAERGRPSARARFFRTLLRQSRLL